MLLCMQLKLVTINSRENCYVLRHFTYFKIGYILQLVNYTDNIFLSVAYTCKVVNKMKNWFCLSSQIVVFFFLIYNPFFFLYFLAVLGLHCCLGFPLVVVSGVTLRLWDMGFSLQWLLLS